MKRKFAGGTGSGVRQIQLHVTYMCLPMCVR